MHLTLSEKVIVKLTRIIDLIDETEKCGTLLCTLLQSVSSTAVVFLANNISFIDLCAPLKLENRRQNSGKQPSIAIALLQPATIFTNSKKDRSTQSMLRNLTC